MDGIQVGYARVSTTDQDLTAQRDAPLRLGVEDAHIYVDHGMTGTNCVRPGLREALAAVRSGDTLVVTKLDRLVAHCETRATSRTSSLRKRSRSVSVAAGTTRPIRSTSCSSMCWGMVAEFERDLISMRTR